MKAREAGDRVRKGVIIRREMKMVQVKRRGDGNGEKRGRDRGVR